MIAFEEDEKSFKRISMVIGTLTAAFLGVLLYGGWQMSGDEINAIRSLKLIGENV